MRMSVSLCRNEYLCFQKITKLEYVIPEGFPDTAKDLVSRLLVISVVIGLLAHTYTHKRVHLYTHKHTPFSQTNTNTHPHTYTHSHSQVLDPAARLGCDQMGGYTPLKEHLFFEDIDWEMLHLQTPPKLMPYLPSSTKGETALRSEILVSVM